MPPAKRRSKLTRARKHSKPSAQTQVQVDSPPAISVDPSAATAWSIDLDLDLASCSPSKRRPASRSPSCSIPHSTDGSPSPRPRPAKAARISSRPPSPSPLPGLDAVCGNGDVDAPIVKPVPRRAESMASFLEELVADEDAAIDEHSLDQVCTKSEIASQIFDLAPEQLLIQPWTRSNTGAEPLTAKLLLDDECFEWTTKHRDTTYKLKIPFSHVDKLEVWTYSLTLTLSAPPLFFADILSQGDWLPHADFTQNDCASSLNVHHLKLRSPADTSATLYALASRSPTLYKFIHGSFPDPPTTQVDYLLHHQILGETFVYDPYESDGIAKDGPAQPPRPPFLPLECPFSTTPKVTPYWSDPAPRERQPPYIYYEFGRRRKQDTYPLTPPHLYSRTIPLPPLAEDPEPTPHPGWNVSKRGAAAELPSPPSSDGYQSPRTPVPAVDPWEVPLPLSPPVVIDPREGYPSPTSEPGRKEEEGGVELNAGGYEEWPWEELGDVLAGRSVWGATSW
ncbi:hypothetical protein MNV49_004947 [Pseudohyphozyma bogoriensis]|nr:hypothetical protein MNV49_004947 [Pseudohyphozyma bogoriensis]